MVTYPKTRVTDFVTDTVEVKLALHIRASLLRFPALTRKSGSCGEADKTSREANIDSREGNTDSRERDTDSREGNIDSKEGGTDFREGDTDFKEGNTDSGEEA